MLEHSQEYQIIYNFNIIKDEKKNWVLTAYGSCNVYHTLDNSSLKVFYSQDILYSEFLYQTDTTSVLTLKSK